MHRLSMIYLIIASTIIVKECSANERNDTLDQLAMESNSVPVSNYTTNITKQFIPLQVFPKPTNNQTFIYEQRPPSKPPIYLTPDKKYYYDIQRHYYKAVPQYQAPPRHMHHREPMRFSVYKLPQGHAVPHYYPKQPPPPVHPASISHPAGMPRNPQTSPPKFPPTSPPKTPPTSPPKTPLTSPPKIPLTSPPKHPQTSPPKHPQTSPPKHPQTSPPNTPLTNPPKSPATAPLKNSQINPSKAPLKGPPKGIPIITVNSIRTDYPHYVYYYPNITTTTAVPTTTRHLRTKRIWPKRILDKMNITTSNLSKEFQDILKKNDTDQVVSASKHRRIFVPKNVTTTTTEFPETTPRPHRRNTRIPKNRSTTPVPDFDHSKPNEWVPIQPSHYANVIRYHPRTKRSVSDVYDEIDDDEEHNRVKYNRMYLQSYGVVPMRNSLRGVLEDTDVQNNQIFHRRPKQTLPTYPSAYTNPNPVRLVQVPQATYPAGYGIPPELLQVQQPLPAYPPAYRSPNLIRHVQQPLAPYPPAYGNLNEYQQVQQPLRPTPTAYRNPHHLRQIQQPHRALPQAYSNPNDLRHLQQPVRAISAYGSSSEVRPVQVAAPPMNYGNGNQIAQASNDIPKVLTKIKHHHHHHHHRYIKTVEKAVKVPYKVEVPKPYAVEKKVPVPVEVEKIKVVEKKVPYPVAVKVPVKVVEKEYVPKLVPVYQQVPVVKHVPVAQPVPVQVEKRVPYPVQVAVPFEKAVPYPVRVEKKVPFPVPFKIYVPKPFPIYKKIPFPVKVKVKEPIEIIKHVPVKIPYPKPYPIKVPHPVPIHVEKRVPYPVEVEKKVPYRVEVPVPHKVEVEKKVPIYIPKPYPVEKKVPYPVKVPYRVDVPYRVPVEVPVYIHHPFQIINDDSLKGEDRGGTAQHLIAGDQSDTGGSGPEDIVTGPPEADVTVHTSYTVYHSGTDGETTPPTTTSA